MNDLKTLRDVWEVPDAPSRAASAHARAALLARASEREVRRGLRLPQLGVRLAVLCGSAAALAVGVAVLEDLGGADGRQESIVPGLVPAANAAQLLERAAVAAERKAFVAPRPDQWVYFEDRYISYAQDGRRLEDGVFRSWHRADGAGRAFIDERGKLQVYEFEPPRATAGRPAPPGGYEELLALPRNPHALLRWAYAQNMENGDDSKDGVVFLFFNHLLRDKVLPPELEAAIFRALKQMPGVTVTENAVDVLGRPAVAIGHTEDWLHEELLLDGQTYAYRGERSTVVKNTTIDPLKAGNSTGEVKKGSKVVVARVARAIVDEPGQR